MGIVETSSSLTSTWIKQKFGLNFRKRDLQRGLRCNISFFGDFMTKNRNLLSERDQLYFLSWIRGQILSGTVNFRCLSLTYKPNVFQRLLSKSPVEYTWQMCIIETLSTHGGLYWSPNCCSSFLCMEVLILPRTESNIFWVLDSLEKLGRHNILKIIWESSWSVNLLLRV